jgi:flavin reductase (DIM6/NTAB) family NADH-FMN oxidoreductase RutF
VPITPREVHAMVVFYTCPRPVVLVSVVTGNSGNIFPMNLMGALGNDYFAFALNAATPVSHLVEKVGHVALSSIPFAQTDLAFRFGKHHKQEYIDWTTLPFATSPSHHLAFPVPTFARRVREMTVESTHIIGSHRLFLARIVSDETRTVGPECFVIHGVYQAWRSRDSGVAPDTALSADCYTPATSPRLAKDEGAESPLPRSAAR